MAGKEGTDVKRLKLAVDQEAREWQAKNQQCDHPTYSCNPESLKTPEGPDLNVLIRGGCLLHKCELVSIDGRTLKVWQRPSLVHFNQDS